MNVAWTRAAEGFPRRAFTVEDVRRMIDAGVIAEDERIELVGGELVVMAAKGYAHELIKTALVKAAVIAATPDVSVGVEMTVQFAPDVMLEPDLLIFRRDHLLKSSTGLVSFDEGGCLLVIEVAASSLSYDKVRKAALYASFGVQEFWVVDANDRTTWIHTSPTAGGWSSIIERRSDETLTTPSLPALSIKLNELD
jgi:Uma2 family endonuclease